MFVILPCLFLYLSLNEACYSVDNVDNIILSFLKTPITITMHANILLKKFAVHSVSSPILCCYFVVIYYYCFFFVISCIMLCCIILLYFSGYNGFYCCTTQCWCLMEQKKKTCKSLCDHLSTENKLIILWRCSGPQADVAATL